MPASSLPGELAITIPARPAFYSLYASGPLERKSYLPLSEETLLFYPPEAAVFLYYTYPAHRAASLVRNVPGSAALPGLSHTVKLLFTVNASCVDKLKKAAAFLSKHSEPGPSGFSDAFYIRLYFVLRLRGKLNYPALRALADAAPPYKENLPC